MNSVATMAVHSIIGICSIGKSEKITKHETQQCHKDALEKKDFLESYEDLTQPVSHDKISY